MSNFSVGFRSAGNVQVLDLNGELDAHTVSEMEAALKKCRDDQAVRIVVNGQHLHYISSAGLGVFLAYIDELRQSGGDIKIAALQPTVSRIFVVTGFPELFEIVDEEDEAIRRFADRTA